MNTLIRATDLRTTGLTSLSPFNYRGVRLLPSRWQQQFQHTRDYYYAIPNDDILRDFRLRAGHPAPGRPLGGWYSGDDKGQWHSQGDIFCTFGQWLSGFSRMSAATGDSLLRDKALHLVREWAKTIASDGYFFKSRHPNAPYYAYEKITGGLVDVAEYLGAPEALDHLDIITRWARNDLERRGFMPPAAGFQNGGPELAEWYTLSENLYRAYWLTGDESYREFAANFHHESYWADLAAGKDAFVGHHAYSHVNSLSSAAMAYAVTRDPRYLQTIQNGYQTLRRNQLYATGGYGPVETFYPADGSLGETLLYLDFKRDTNNGIPPGASAETTCGSWAGFKLSRYLMQFSGQAHYGDWSERLFYNAMGAALPMVGRGRTFYYSNYMLHEAHKYYHQTDWPCCSGTYPMAVADYHNLIYYYDDRGLYLNLFVPSEVTWQQDGALVRLTQDTLFPEAESTTLTVHTSGPVEFSLRVRQPGWAAAPLAAQINGQPISMSLQPSGWLALSRTWQDGDVLALSLPMPLWFQPVDVQHPHRAALLKGPVVLVADAGPALTGDQADPGAWIEPVESPLHLHTRGANPDRTFQPFYELPENVRYWMYQNIQPA